MSNFETISLNCLPREEMNKFLTLNLIEEMDKHLCSEKDLDDLKSITRPYKDSIDVLNNIIAVLRHASCYSDRLFESLQHWRFKIYDYLENGYQFSA